VSFFFVNPANLAAPDEPLVGAEAVHRLLRSWRMAGDSLRLAVPSPAPFPAL
jgi:hypothetical protein